MTERACCRGVRGAHGFIGKMSVAPKSIRETTNNIARITVKRESGFFQITIAPFNQCIPFADRIANGCALHARQITIGMRVLEPVQPCMDLAHLKREFGKDLVFWGGIATQDVLPFGTPEQVRQMARQTIRTLGRGGGHIIAPSQEVMNDVPIENVKALVETIVEERQTVLSL